MIFVFLLLCIIIHAFQSIYFLVPLVSKVTNLHPPVEDYIYLELCHWQTWLPPWGLEALQDPTHRVQCRLVREMKTLRFSTVWFWTIWSGTRGPLRTWTPASWGDCRCPLKATSRRWSRGAWRAAPSSRSWPVWAVRHHTDMMLQLLHSSRSFSVLVLNKILPSELWEQLGTCRCLEEVNGINMASMCAIS